MRLSLTTDQDEMIVIFSNVNINGFVDKELDTLRYIMNSFAFNLLFHRSTFDDIGVGSGISSSQRSK